jgi:hypothetical protein
MDCRPALVAVVLLCAGGCADIAMPRLLHPGPEAYQQNRAERFDPYLMTDVAPEVVGGRPLQYIKPAPENERNQNEMTFEERYHQVPPPGMYRPPRSTGSRQGIIYSTPAVVPAPGTGAPIVELPPGSAPPFSP